MSQHLLFQPVSPFHINQGFYDNNACISTDGMSRVVTRQPGMSCPVGFKSLYADGRHGALDLRAYHGQEVYCAQGGTVYKIDTNPKSGLDVRVESFVGGRRIRHIYEHLLGYQAKVGDELKTGQLVGWADNTGYSSGDHLHFQVEEYQGGKWVKIDPEPLMAPIFAKDVLKAESTIKYLQEQVALLADRFATYLRTRAVSK